MTRSPVSVVAGRSVRPSIDLFGPFSGSDRRFFSLRSKERWLRRGTLPALLLGWVAATVGWLAPLAAQAPPGGGPEITNVVASGPSKVDVTYSLDQNYPGGKTGQVRLEI
ncbi:MAG TPA: hypothetical protein ENJ50_08380, partial [Planctomycetaceae bacterium]|nr:hypothetical protein [Planctomycetaceae bacterium]